MGSNPIVYLLIIIGSIVNYSYYFSGFYYGPNTLQPTSKEGIIPSSIYRWESWDSGEISSLPRLYNLSVMKVGSESRFIQSQALIVGQFRISLSHLLSATPPITIIPRPETTAKAWRDNGVKRWSHSQSDRGARLVNNSLDHRACSKVCYNAAGSKMQLSPQRSFLSGLTFED